MASAGSLRLAAVMATMGKSQPQVSSHFHSAKTFFRVRRMVSRSTLPPGSTPSAPSMEG